ncbi:MAG: hypothetical protein HC895_15685 [Leptolyngbyaceae cyanobacterium SM1_3_5]|nr:hypothetical protein [Leptolyngbyaceae cyanobacterium SM1_3_5]
MSLNVTPVTGTATEIAAALLAEIAGNTTGFSNIQATITGKPESFGKFTGDPFGLTSGIVLSTGFATQAVGPNQFENLSGDLNGDPATNGGVFDEAVLTITFDSASATKAFFSYVFASDEFVEFGGSEFNDKFELLINGVNAARLNNGDEISVNALVPDVNDPATWSPDFIDNTGGQESQDTEFDGYTKFLNFEADINAGANTIAIRLKDVGDNEYDSAVFIKQGSFGTIKPIVPTPPPAPTAIDLLTDTATTASASTTDNRTYEATPDFSGQGSKAGNIIKLFSRVDGLIGQTTIAADRTWTIANASFGGQDLLVGEHRIFAIEYDAVSGLASRRSSELSVFIDSPDRETDTTAPTAPVNLDLVTASDDVNSFGSQTNTDNDTNDRTPTISGEAEPNSVITLYSDKDGAIGSARVGRDGKWSITATQLRSGDHVITAEARDWAGNVSGRSTDLNLSVRNVPSTPDLTAGSDTGASPSDNLTLDSTPTFQGVAEAGSTVELFIDGASVGTVTADAQGKWAFTSTALAEGVHTIQARATNRQTGTYDDLSKELRFTIDRTLPLVTTPDLSATSDNGPSNSDDITSIKSPSFTGTADPGSTVTVASSLDGVLGTAIADATGKWTLNVSTRKKLQSGNHQITAQAVDAAGNQSPISAPLSLTSLPDVSAPDLKASSDSGVSSSDNYTNDTTPTFTGTGELGSTVTLFYLDGTGTRVNIGSIVVSTDDGEGGGLWEITTTTLPEGVYDIRAEAEKSGFTSFTSNLLQVTIDTDNNGTIRTDAPANLDLTTATDSGTDTTDNITTNNRPTFTGTGVAGNSIELFDGATKIGTAIVRADGTWEITPAAALALGSHDISARQIDKAGNISDFSPVLSAPNKVTIVPRPSAGRPDLIAADDSGISNTDNLTKNNTPTLTGTGSIGSTIEIFDGAAKIGTALVDGSGNWSFTAPTLSDRTHR